MSRYIDTKWLEENAKEYSLGYYDYDEYAVPLSALDEAPSIDIEPKRGEWIVHEARTEVNDGFIDFFPTEYECSNCGLKQSMYFINSKPSNFCPNCGADMREESE